MTPPDAASAGRRYIRAGWGNIRSQVNWADRGPALHVKSLQFGGGDRFDDAGGGLDGGEAVFDADFDGFFAPDGGDERFELGPKGLDVVDLEFFDVHDLAEVQIRQVGDLTGADFGGGFADRVDVPTAAGDQAVLLLVIERDVGVGAEEAHASLGLEGEARGGHVCYAAVVEGEACIADVLHVADDADADGVDLGDLRAGQSEDDVDVVNHHVEDDADIDAAESHRADADDFNESGFDFEAADRKSVV